MPAGGSEKARCKAQRVARRARLAGGHGAYGPSMSQMFADQYSGENGWRRLPRAPLRSPAEYLEFCRCLLDEPGHERWQVLLRELGCPAPDDWIAYAAKYATLPPLPAHLTPAPVWSFLSSVVLLYPPPSARLPMVGAVLARYWVQASGEGQGLGHHWAAFRLLPPRWVRCRASGFRFDSTMFGCRQPIHGDGFTG